MSIQVPMPSRHVPPARSIEIFEPVEQAIAYLEVGAILFLLALLIGQISPVRLLSLNPLRWYLVVLEDSARHSLLRYRVILVLCMVSFCPFAASALVYFSYLLSEA